MEIIIPSSCPSCSTELKRISVDLVCENKTCPEKVKGLFINFINILDIKQISDKFIEKAIEKYNISTLKDLFDLSLQDIEKLPGFASQSAKIAYEAVHSVKKMSPAIFFAILNIPNLSTKTFENLFESFDYKRLLTEKIKVSELASIKGIGEITALAILEGISERLEMISDNLDLFEIVEEVKVIKESAIVGKKFCITGKFYKMKRPEAEKLIKEYGGLIASVNKTLDYLVTNEESSSDKWKKVNALNSESTDKKIQIISEQELYDLIGV